MPRRTAYLWIGLALFVVGGVLLTFARETVGTPVGTTVGLGGLLVLAWGLLGGRTTGNE